MKKLEVPEDPGSPESAPDSFLPDLNERKKKKLYLSKVLVIGVFCFSVCTCTAGLHQ